LGVFEWNNSYSVGTSSIDAPHQNLFAMGRELHTAMSTGQAGASRAKILERLVQHTSVHFANEERLMRQAVSQSL
jgi:hemerythrin-like metal-binding protein